jgi:hypothetical protein
MSKNTNLSFLTDYITADITNGRIGINNASPTVAFDVVGATKITGALTLTGALGGTSASFSGLLTVTNNVTIRPTSGYNAYFQTSGTTLRINYLNDALSANISAAYRATDYSFQDASGGAILTLASTGAATFSSSITAGGRYFASASVADNIVEVINTDTTNGYGLFVRAGGTAANRYVARFKNAADSDVMWIDKGGNVGIGTTSPSYKLDVLGSSGALAKFSDGTTNTFIYSGGGSSCIGADVNINNGLIITGGSNIAQINTNGVERMRITSGGNVGIGSTNPSAKLLVLDSAGTTTNTLLVESVAQTSGHTGYFYSNSAQSGNTLRVYQDGAGSTGPALYVYSDGAYGAVFEKGNVGIGTTTPDERLTVGAGNGISIRTLGSGTFGSLKFGSNVSTYYDAWAGIDSDNEATGANVSNLRFYTSYGVRGERMRIGASGNFYVYSMAASAGTNAVKFNTSTGQVTYDTSSLKYKDNIRDSVYGLNAVMQLKSKMFEYKEDNRTDIGLIAEEVYEVIPELVGLDKEGLPNSVSYDRFVSVLVKAIQELSAEINILKNK